tara:strand:+ start:54185 stop:54406 length:222 start_codon:yes stop_codon:yes gene_type:complete
MEITKLWINGEAQPLDDIVEAKRKLAEAPRPTTYIHLPASVSHLSIEEIKASWPTALPLPDVFVYSNGRSIYL